MSKPILWENKENIVNLSSAEFAHRVVKFKFVIIVYFQIWIKRVY